MSTHAVILTEKRIYAKFDSSTDQIMQALQKQKTKQENSWQEMHKMLAMTFNSWSPKKTKKKKKKKKKSVPKKHKKGKKRSKKRRFGSSRDISKKHKKVAEDRKYDMVVYQPQDPKQYNFRQVYHVCHDMIDL